MNKKVFLSLSLVIVIVLVAVIVYNNQKANKIEVINDENQAVNDILQKPQITVDAKYQYKDGTHTYIGSIEVPNPCYDIKTRVEDEAEQKIINIDYTSNLKQGESCVEVVDTKDFKFSFEGPRDIGVVAKVNGELVNLNLFEVPAGQNIEDFEIFNKG